MITAKRIIITLACFITILCSVACADSSVGQAQSPIEAESQASAQSSPANADTEEDIMQSSSPQPNFESDKSANDILIAYFSLAGEQYEVGEIEKGNTEIIAEMIAEKTGGNLFKIETDKEYPNTYDGLLEASQEEKDSPPSLITAADNFEVYNTIFLGYPIWWGDLPETIRVFLENYDFSGKIIIPFSTHAGSGLASTPESITALCGDTEVLEGFSVRGSMAQNYRESAELIVDEWLNNNGFVQS